MDREDHSKEAGGVAAPALGAIARASSAIARTAAIGLLLAGCAGAAQSGAGDVFVQLPRGAKLLPARIRRLTNLEIERSLAALTHVETSAAADLPPDLRQEGYTPNAAQDVSTAWALRYAEIARTVAERAVETKLADLAPCADLGAACVGETVDRLGQRAYRRALSAEEKTALEGALAEGAREIGSFSGGLGILLRALLESPSFLYVTELGEGSDAGTPGSTVRLSPDEIASALSFMLRGGPPDGELMDAAKSGALRDPRERIRQARRLLSLSDTRYQFRRFALEWLEVDGLEQSAKSTRAFPEYEALKPHMLAETENYVDEVLVNGGASVRALLTGGFASVDPEMARFYGLASYGPRASLGRSGRIGVLQQASFLAAHAHEDVTSPVKRGDFVMRKLLCEEVKRPGEIGLEVVMPEPSDRLTNRERFAAHTADPACARCHTTLDALGYTFERFDAIGRAQATDHGRPVESAAEVKLDGKALRLSSSLGLSEALAGREAVSTCFARHAFRYFSAQSDPAVEASFLGIRRGLGEGARDNLFDALLAYIGSDLFVMREVKAP